MSQTATDAGQRRVSISLSAAGRIATLLKEEDDDALMLRVAISGGGCSGFQYGFSFDSAVGDEDRVFEENGAKVVIDEASLELLAGAEVDFVEELGASYFAMKNPNAKSVCGCGTSFSI
ncbi:MAG: iron-sulfur cluster insertion protein ErpA [Rhodospirillales bacterium]|jgi:iron-sulfur cluster insertion protein|nr:iron-sulfur cluster insertion protein ErpA [Rhodospirillales bacterium]MDP6773619.1 iron-sulfur cluster insertion protein ErpA [Rhodospirillales bacterium]